MITIYFPELLQEEATIEIYDLVGKKLNREGLELIKKEGSFIFYNSSPLEPGQYIATLKTTSGIIRKMKITKPF